MAEKPLHILFLSSWYPSRVHRTLGNFVERHAEAVATIHKVTVLYLTSDPTVERTEVEYREVNGMNTVCVYFNPGTFRPRDHYQALMVGWQALQNRGLDSIDLIHGNVLYPSAMQAIVLQRKLHVPFIYTEHWTGFHRESSLGIGLGAKLMLKHACHKASFVCPVSNHLGRSMQNWGLKGRYKTVPNVVDTDLFKPGEKGDRFRFIHVSSLVDEHKNISGMLRAIAQVLKNDPNMEFWFVGDGDINPHKRYARELKIAEDSIHFMGEQSIHDIARLMSKSHAFLMFSHYENLPCVILEAFACGIPVIASDTGGIREHLDPSRGILVTNGAEDELERAILQVKKGYHDFDVNEIREYASSHFSVNSIANQFSDIYQESLQK